jgi:hypothetical protein
MTDDMPITRLSADEAIEAIRQAPHLAPIFQAMFKDNVHVLPINQGVEPFDFPSAGRPWILLIQDDPEPGNLSLGPEGFDRKSLETAIQAATLAAVVAGDPITEIYARVASEAAHSHNNAVLIETWLTHESQWTSLIKETKPDIQLVLGTVQSGQA